MSIQDYIDLNLSSNSSDDESSIEYYLIDKDFINEWIEYSK